MTSVKTSGEVLLAGVKLKEGFNLLFGMNGNNSVMLHWELRITFRCSAY